MQNTQNGKNNSTPNTSSIIRRFREFALIGRDPILFMSLLLAGIFIFVFIVFPLFRSVSGGFISKEGAFDVTYFARYFDNYYGPSLRKAFTDTMLMGVSSAALGTLLGFIFAYAVVRCNIPGKRGIHWLALVPTVSPPFALALSMILLFGRNGLITNKVFGITFELGMNDVYGLDGLVIVQSITFFSVSYLILRAMLERLNPAIEEAASSLGAGRFHLFRTITLPLLIPGIAASFLLLFVESLADLGNPLFLSGARTVLSAQIFLAVIGEYNYQKASAISFVLMIPTLVIFLIQRYYVNRRTYISVTGKPAGTIILEKDPIIRWIFNILTYAIIAFILLLYVTIVYGSFSTAWGVDFTPTLRHWEMAVTRGIEAILDTTFLSALATPFAAILGMIIAWLVVRKNFTGKSLLDFTSNLGGAVPGTILGIGFVMAFNKPPLAIAIGIYAVMALFFASVVGKSRWEKIIIMGLGTATGVALNLVYEPYMYYILGGFYIIAAIYLMVTQKMFRKPLILAVLGVYVMSTNWAILISKPIADFSRSLERGFWSNAIFQASDHIKVLVQPTPALLAIALVFAGVLLLQNLNGKTTRIGIGILMLAVPCALSFVGVPYAMVGGAYIIMGAFIVRSVPASVRSGIAALQQIDPSIEEASNILGADAQYTFRKVTLPLILPALFAGLVFSFTRHMTSVSAIIFLISAKWRIVTASILSEWEQGGVSIAAAYSTIIIIIVLIAIFVLNLIVNKLFKGRGSVDMSQGF